MCHAYLVVSTIKYFGRKNEWSPLPADEGVRRSGNTVNDTAQPSITRNGVKYGGVLLHTSCASRVLLMQRLNSSSPDTPLSSRSSSSPPSASLSLPRAITSASPSFASRHCFRQQMQKRNTHIIKQVDRGVWRTPICSPRRGGKCSTRKRCPWGNP